MTKKLVIATINANDNYMSPIAQAFKKAANHGKG